MVSNCLNGIACTFPNVGILLVRELLLERFDGPEGQRCQQMFAQFFNSKATGRSPHNTDSCISRVEKAHNGGGFDKRKYGDLLCGDLVLLDGRINKSSEVVCRSVDVFLGLGNP